MNNEKNPLEDEEQYRNLLIRLHFVGKRLYSMSFMTRLGLDLKYSSISYGGITDEDTKEFEGLTIKEIREKSHNLKAPWWNDIYEKKIKPDHELSEAIYQIILEELKNNKEEEHPSYGLGCKFKRILNCLFHNKK
jgi:hypothetical protein